MSRSALFFMIVPLVPIAAVIWVFARPPWTPLRIAGLLITVVFLALLTVARLQLGNAFSVTPQARMLVSHGIYSKIRHPVYVFSAFAATGLFLYMGMFRLLWLIVVLIPIQFARARKEEQVLTERFGQAYLEYKKTTWF